MPSTYQIISSTTLTSAAATVTLSSIPGTYTDLVVRFSARMDSGAFTNDQIALRFNGVTTSSYAWTRFRGDGSNAVSYSPNTTETSGYVAQVSGSGAASNTFGNGEVYIPNYTSSTQKASYAFSAGEDNATPAYLTLTSNLGTATTSISSITFLSINSNNFVSGSSFYLYGIKNS